MLCVYRDHRHKALLEVISTLTHSFRYCDVMALGAGGAVSGKSGVNDVYTGPVLTFPRSSSLSSLYLQALNIPKVPSTVLASE